MKQPDVTILIQVQMFKNNKVSWLKRGECKSIKSNSGGAAALPMTVAQNLHHDVQ